MSFADLEWQIQCHQRMRCCEIWIEKQTSWRCWLSLVTFLALHNYSISIMSPCVLEQKCIGFANLLYCFFIQYFIPNILLYVNRLTSNGVVIAISCRLFSIFKTFGAELTSLRKIVDEINHFRWSNHSLRIELLRNGSSRETTKNYSFQFGLSIWYSWSIIKRLATEGKSTLMDLVKGLLWSRNWLPAWRWMFSFILRAPGLFITSANTNTRWQIVARDVYESCLKRSHPNLTAACCLETVVMVMFTGCSSPGRTEYEIRWLRF